MVPRPTPSSEEVIALLARLKMRTPDYPAHLLAARKTAFLEQAATWTIQGQGPRGDGGLQSGNGGPGPVLGGANPAHGMVLQAVIGFGLVASMLIGAYVIHEQISGRLEGDTLAVVQSTEQTILPVTGASDMPTETETATATPVVTPTVTVTIAGSDTVVENELDDPMNIDDLLDIFKDNPGLHLGQATGTPAAPGQGNPGNQNQPDKPEKPQKPEKPEKPGKGR